MLLRTNNFQPCLIEFSESGNIALAWLWRTGIGIILAGFSSIIIVYFRPSAGGSGIPELIAFLNGTSIRHIYNVRTLLAKFISCAFAVSSGNCFSICLVSIYILFFRSICWSRRADDSYWCFGWSRTQPI